MKQLLQDSDFGRIPFAYIGDSREMSAQVGPHRLNVIRKFIADSCWSSGSKTLDVGGPNKFGELLFTTHNTLNYDLNFHVEAPSSDYNVIFCFEIIEHLMNPLFLMTELHKLLCRGGVMYLSTPRPFFGFLQGKQHFTEYKPDRIEQMFRYAGFEVLRRRKFCLWNWWFMFWGFRPIFRVLFHRNYLWELRKAV